MRTLSILTTFVSLLAATTMAVRATADTAVTSCGQEVQGDGTLAADLDCTGFPAYGVTVVNGTLDLAGFTLTGGDFGSVHCPGPCRVVGPGTITASPFAGIVAFGPLRTVNVDLTNHGSYGIECFRNCKLVGGTISDNGDGVRGAASARISGLTITGNVDNGVRLTGDSATATVVIRSSTISNNGDEGVSADRAVAVVGGTISGNGGHGVRAGTVNCSGGGVVKLKNATVTGNGTAPDCGVSETCADVAACIGPPAVKVGSTCETSYVQGSGFPGTSWNVCTLD